MLLKFKKYTRLKKFKNYIIRIVYLNFSMSETYIVLIITKDVNFYITITSFLLLTILMLNCIQFFFILLFSKH